MAPRRLPSFFKILLHPSDPHLQLPDAFVRKHLENKIPENPILRSGGYSWNLKIKKLGEDYCFVNGWNQVAQDSQLGYADFLVFWLVDPSTFKLSIFSPSGCERYLPLKNDVVKVEEEEEEGEDEDKEEEEEGDGILGDSGDDEEGDDVGGGDSDVDESDPFFVTIMSKGHASSLRLPAKFARLAGTNRERLITMRNLDGKECQLGLKLDSHHYIRYYLSAGWREFMWANKLSEGDKCVFKYIRNEDKLCLTKVTKSQGGKALAGQVLKRPRGRPQKKDDGAKVVKRPRGSPPKRKRGRPSRVEVVKKDEDLKVVKRPRGRPFKKKRGRPSSVDLVKKDGDLKAVKRPLRTHPYEHGELK